MRIAIAIAIALLAAFPAFAQSDENLLKGANSYQAIFFVNARGKCEYREEDAQKAFSEVIKGAPLKEANTPANDLFIWITVTVLDVSGQPDVLSCVYDISFDVKTNFYKITLSYNGKTISADAPIFQEGTIGFLQQGDLTKKLDGRIKAYTGQFLKKLYLENQ